MRNLKYDMEEQKTWKNHWNGKALFRNMDLLGGNAKNPAKEFDTIAEDGTVPCRSQSL